MDSELTSFSPIPAQQTRNNDNAPPPSTLPPRIPCNFPGCSKTFRRKEHLNRHVHSHDSARPHKCYICNRSFARKDILHRHVLQHNATPEADPKRTLLACETCRRRKIKCDSNDPCEACESSSVPCIRSLSNTRNRISRIQLPGQQNQSQLHDVDLYGQRTVENDHDDDQERYSGSDDGWEDRLDDEPVQSRRQNQSHSVPTGTSQNIDFYHREDATQSPTDSGTHSIEGSAAQSRSMSSVLSNANLPDHQTARTGSGTKTTPGSELQAFKSAIPGDIGSGHLEVATSTTNDLPAIDDFMLWMNGVDSNAMTNAVPTPNTPALLPTGNDNIQLERLFHMFWPLLHLPTLNIETATPALVQTLEHVKNWVQQNSISEPTHFDLTENKQTLQDFMKGRIEDISLSSRRRTISIGCFQTLQALGLLAASAITGVNQPAILDWAVWCVDVCIAYLRQMGVFQGTRKIEQQLNIADERWIMEENFNRLAATFLRLDFYIGLILNRAPTLRWPEMSFKFPASDTIWRAATPEERRVLLWHEPAGRSSTSFRTILRDGLMNAKMQGLLQLKQLHLEDYNLALCAFSSDVWEVTQEVRHHDQRTYKSASQDASEDVALWSSYLLDMRAHMEMNYNLEANFFAPGSPSNPPPPFHHLADSAEAVLAITTSAINMTLYHLLQLIMFANIPILETGKCCEDCQDLDVSARVRSWASGPDGRRAVVYAAQLRRVYEREICATGYPTCLTPAQRRISNPARSIGLFYSAVVICSFIDRAPCIHDSPQAINNIDELARPEIAGHICDDLKRWIDEGCGNDGIGEANLHLMGVPLCRCYLPALTAWYCDQLGPSSTFGQRLIKFQAMLHK